MDLIIDFLVLGALAAAFIGAFMFLAARRPDNTAYKYAVGLALVVALFLFWSNGAVGIIGASGNDANMMYHGVLAVGLGGALIAHFRPHGMACALFATALAQAMVPVVALVGGAGSPEVIWTWDVLILTGIFAALWLVSAGLFWKAALGESKQGGL